MATERRAWCACARKGRMAGASGPAAFWRKLSVSRTDSCAGAVAGAWFLSGCPDLPPNWTFEVPMSLNWRLQAGEEARAGAAAASHSAPAGPAAGIERLQGLPTAWIDGRGSVGATVLAAARGLASPGLGEPACEPPHQLPAQQRRARTPGSRGSPGSAQGGQRPPAGPPAASSGGIGRRRWRQQAPCGLDPGCLKLRSHSVLHCSYNIWRAMTSAAGFAALQRWPSRKRWPSTRLRGLGLDVQRLSLVDARLPAGSPGHACVLVRRLFAAAQRPAPSTAAPPRASGTGRH